MGIIAYDNQNQNIEITNMESISLKPIPTNGALQFSNPLTLLNTNTTSYPGQILIANPNVITPNGNGVNTYTLFFGVEAQTSSTPTAAALQIIPNMYNGTNNDLVFISPNGNIATNGLYIGNGSNVNFVGTVNNTLDDGSGNLMIKANAILQGTNGIQAELNYASTSSGNTLTIYGNTATPVNNVPDIIVFKPNLNNPYQNLTLNLTNGNLTAQLNNAVFIANGFNTIAQPATNQTVGASPFTYKNNTNSNQEVFITGGTITGLTITPANGTTAITLNTSISQLVLRPTDAITITYSAAPTITTIQL